MATLQELEQALVNAHKAGDQMAAAKLANIIKKERDRRLADPEIEAREQVLKHQTDVPGTVVEPEEAGIGEKALGVGEAALSTATALTGGAAGFAGGFIKGLAQEVASGKIGTQEAANRIKESAEELAADLTYAPRTKTGQEYAAEVGETLQKTAGPLITIAPQLQAIGGLARGAATQARGKLMPPKGRVPAAEAPVELRPSPGAVAPEAAPVQMELPGMAPKVSVDAAEMAGRPTMAPPGVKPRMKAKMSPQEQEMLLKASEREARAASLEEPIQLTKGQKTQEFGQQQFERETAKTEVGAPLRERYAQQNAALETNLEKMIDSTGAEFSSDLRNLGQSVVSPLTKKAASDKANINMLYDKAASSPEANMKTNLMNFVKYLDETMPESESANILKTARGQAQRMGVFEIVDGKTRIKPITLKDAEALRKAINRSTNMEAPNQYHASKLKAALDSDTEAVGGKLYNAARRARREYAEKYKEIGLVKSLLENKKGTSDRQVAVENVFQKVILDKSTSRDSLAKLKGLLTDAEGGKQAWQELKGGLFNHLKNEAFSNMQKDQAGNVVISPAKLERAISTLEKSGKLEELLGKDGVKKLKLFNEVVKDVAISPQGTVNTSNTASALINFGSRLIGMMGMKGVPAPIAPAIDWLIGSIRNQALKMRVQKALKG